MENCRRCGTALPNPNPMIQPGRLVKQRELWEARAREWCVECQREFLRQQEDIDEKIHDVIDAQDGKYWNRGELKYVSGREARKLLGKNWNRTTSGLPRQPRRIPHTYDAGSSKTPEVREVTVSPESAQIIKETIG